RWDFFHPAVGSDAARAGRPVPLAPAPLIGPGRLLARLRRPEQLLPSLQAVVRPSARAVPQPAPQGPTAAVDAQLESGSRQTQPCGIERKVVELPQRDATRVLLPSDPHHER